MDLGQTDEKPLFGSVPPGLFRVFAGSARHFFADLLAHLAYDPFGQAGEIATRKRVVDAIAESIDRRGRAEVVRTLASDGTVPAPGQSYIAAYNRLTETGWLAEYRDRYRRVVDFDPAARLVLNTLLDIQNGRVVADIGILHHWGDIDPGGVRIGRHLETALGVEVRPHLMEPAVAMRLDAVPRSPQPAPRMPAESAFAQLAAYLQMPHAAWLEQEIVDPSPVDTGSSARKTRAADPSPSQRR